MMPHIPSAPHSLTPPRLICLLLVLALQSSVFAATWTWNVTSGNWDVAGNWNPASVPTSTSADVINLTNGTSILSATTTLNTGRNIGGVTIGAFNTLNLTAAATITTNAPGIINNGVIETASTGQINSKALGSTNTGIIQALSGGTLTLNALPLTNTGGTVRARTGGTVNFISSTSTITNGTLQSETGGVLRVVSSNDSSPGGSLTLTGVTVSNAGTFINESIHIKDTTNATNYAVTTTLATGTQFTNALNAIATVSNSGTQGASSPTGTVNSAILVQSGATFTNQGTLNVLNSATRTSVSSQQSTFTVASGATFSSTGTINVVADSTATGASSTFTSAQSIANDGIVRVKGNAANTSATFSVTGAGNDYTQSSGVANRTVLEQGGALTVADQVLINGGTLGGVGTVTGATTIGGDATLVVAETFASAGTPGAGQLTFNSTLTLADNAEVRFGLGTDTVSSGRILLAGAANLDIGGNVTLTLSDLTAGNWQSGTTYRLFDLESGSIGGTTFVLNVVPEGWEGVLSSGTSGTDFLDLTLTAVSNVPEPSSYATLAALAALAWTAGRRVRSTADTGPGSLST